MAILVVCPTCGAPQRVALSLTRFTCSACQGLADLDPGLVEEQLVVAATVSAERAVEAARRALAAAGVREVRVEARPAVHVPVWQILSTAGEEHIVVAGAAHLPSPGLLRLPTAPVLRRDDPRVRGLEPLPAPTVDRAAAIEAAASAFAAPDAPLASVRLIWVTAAPLSIHTRAGSVEGWVLAGTERVLLPPLPDGATGIPIARAHVQALGVYLTLCLAWGILAPGGTGLRALGALVLFAAGIGTWRVGVSRA